MVASWNRKLRAPRSLGGAISDRYSGTDYTENAHHAAQLYVDVIAGHWPDPAWPPISLRTRDYRDIDRVSCLPTELRCNSNIQLYLPAKDIALQL